MGPFWIFLILVAISIISQIATSFADKQRVAALLKAINDAGFDATNSLPEVDAERYFEEYLTTARRSELAKLQLREFGFNRSTLLIIEWDEKVTVDNYQDSIRKGLELLAVARS